MAPDDYFDAIGDVLAYVLSADDKIVGQHEVTYGKYFTIDRQGTELRFRATTQKRYFELGYRISLIDRFTTEYGRNEELYEEHLSEYDIENQLSEKESRYLTAFERVSDIDEEHANRAVTDVGAQIFHSDCRIRPLFHEDQNEPDNDDADIWDGIRAVGLLYPYESEFGPGDYENVAQQVISVGTQIEESLVKNLGLSEELDTPKDRLT